MKFVFVITYGRSGSTLLMNLLNAIDGFCIRGENGGLVTTLAVSADTLQTMHDINGRWDHGPTAPWFGFGPVSPGRWRTSLAELFVDQILMPPPGTRVSGFKEIRYTPEHMDEETFAATMDFLANAFPDARLIFNTRDAAQVANSGWWKTDYQPAQVHQLIAESDRRFRYTLDRLGERAFIIDYAEYDGRPEGFQPLLQWLGEDVPPEQIEAICAERLMHLQKAQPGFTRRAIGWLGRKLRP
ncbi:hypothetical protein FHS61_000230 [Altererythrobacter atlanticus]|uniref:Uncharacterized protein n=1 Tax=Croceibacterium atlanticum TaxID=1267766 RepID=A0A0F7KUK4_9SPHN|nr:sulfotransferase [Croceibacterium atlanticum]AKH42460.1 hypothetical protein WYH_01419 [Croceibacterium atlanticum]MBB5731237.1 hypothetical protein [Croceibacterium atlanticum]